MWEGLFTTSFIPNPPQRLRITRCRTLYHTYLLLALVYIITQLIIVLCVCYHYVYALHACIVITHSIHSYHSPICCVIVYMCNCIIIIQCIHYYTIQYIHTVTLCYCAMLSLSYYHLTLSLVSVLPYLPVSCAAAMMHAFLLCV